MQALSIPSAVEDRVVPHCENIQQALFNLPWLKWILLSTVRSHCSPCSIASCLLSPMSFIIKFLSEVEILKVVPLYSQLLS